MSSLSTKRLVNIAISLSAMPPAKKNFGIGFILGDSAILPSENRVRAYTGLDGVAADFPTNSEEYLAAARFYGQSPRPRDLKIGRRFPTGSAGHLNSAALTASDLAAIQAVTDGCFDITIDGGLEQLPEMDFHTDTTWSAVAARLNTALNAAATGTTCTYDGTKLVITSPTLVTGTVSYAAAPTGGSTPTAIQAILKLTLATGASTVAPLATETCTQSLQLCRNVGPFYSFSLASDSSDQDKKDAAAWAEANDQMYFYTISDSDALSAVDTTNLGYFFKNLGYNNTSGMYHPTDLNAALSVMGKACTVNYDGQGTVLTLMFKQLPGVAVTELTSDQADALEGHNLNYYGSYGDFPMLAKGVVANGRWIDEVMGLAWFIDACNTAVFRRMATSPTKIPFTNDGVGNLLSSLEQPCAQGVSNGLFAPGTWNQPDIGTLLTGDPMPKGYYLFAGPVEDVSDADRENRIAPALVGAVNGAGALQGVSGTITFQR